MQARVLPGLGLHANYLVELLEESLDSFVMGGTSSSHSGQSFRRFGDAGGESSSSSSSMLSSGCCLYMSNIFTELCEREVTIL